MKSRKDFTFTCLYSLILFINIYVTSCGIINFEEKELLTNKTLQYKIGLVTGEDAIFGDKDTTFSVNQTIKMLNTDNDKEIHFQVLFYFSEESDEIGITEDGILIYCCSPNIGNNYDCDPGSVIVQPESLISNRVHAYNVIFNRTNTANLIFNITEFGASGIYYLKYFNCPESNVGNVAIFGDIKFQNPFGQLSGEIFPLLPFFFLLACSYLFLGISWGTLCVIHRSKLLPLQHWISLVICLGMIESITWTFDLFIYNEFGHFSWTAITIGIFTSTIKRTLSRLLVLVVSMGYGVVKANLGSENVKKVLTLGILYFLVSGSQQIILAYLREEDNEFLSFIATMIIFPAALLDTVFYWWIFLSLVRTIQQLTLRKQDVKLRMYKRFFIVLISSGVITCLIILYQTVLTIFSSPDELWDTWWMFQAFWEIQYFAILFAISYLWRPTQNNSRYAYVASEDAEIMLQSINKDDIGDEITLEFDLNPLESHEMEEELSKMD